MRYRSPSPGSRQGGQSSVEAAVVTVALVLGLWSAGVWLGEADGSALAQWLDGLRRGYARFVAVLATPL